MLLSIGYKQYFHSRKIDGKYLSIMICRGCSDLHAVKKIKYQYTNLEDIKRRNSENSKSVLKAFSLGFVDHTHRYLIIEENQLQEGQEYITDFEVHLDESSKRLAFSPKTAILLKNSTNDFSNKNEALSGGVFSYLLRKKGNSSCNTREGDVVLLSKYNDTTLFLAKNPIDACNEAEQFLISIDPDFHKMKRIYDIVFPFANNADLKNDLSYNERYWYFEKNLYISSISEQFLTKLDNTTFKPIFVKGNKLYDLVHSQLCYTNKCFFKENATMAEVVNNFFTLEYNNHNFQEEIHFTQYYDFFNNLQAKIREGHVFTLKEFNKVAQENLDIRDQANYKIQFETLYEFYKKFNASDERVKQQKYDFSWSKQEFLVPIVFSKVCPPGEQTIIFNEDYGPMEACLGEHWNGLPWLPIESKYYIYFDYRDHQENAGRFLEKYGQGWILHPDISRGFNYNEKQSGYEFLIEVYVKPYFGSGFVPLGREFIDTTCFYQINPIELDEPYKSVFDYSYRSNYKFLIYYLLLFFNNPTLERFNAGTEKFIPRGQEFWNQFDGTNFFSTEKSIIMFHHLKNGAECLNDKPFILPVRIREGNSYLEYRIKDDNVYLNEINAGDSSNHIDNVYYFEMKLIEEKDKKIPDFFIDFANSNIRLLFQYGFRPFLVPDHIKHKSVIDGILLKEIRPHRIILGKDNRNLRIALRIWVRDDFRLQYKWDQLCEGE